MPVTTSQNCDGFVIDNTLASSASSPHVGLVVYALDVSSSMANINDCLAKCATTTMELMKVVCPGVAQAVVTYTDFDSPSLDEPPAIDALNTLNWKPNGSVTGIHLRGDGSFGCETFDIALNFILRELVPEFHKKENCDINHPTPVLIFNITDEDIRLRYENSKK